MNKTAAWLCAAILACAAAQPARGVEFRPFGSAEFVVNAASNLGTFEPWGGRYGFQDSADAWHNYGEWYHPKHSRVVQRFIMGMDIVASESLSAHYDAICGFFTWGGPATGSAPTNGGALGTRAANIVTRQAYLDWMVPGTSVKVRMGHQYWAAPAFAVGTANPFRGDDFGSGVMISAPLNGKAGFTFGWIRAASDSRRGTTSTTGLRTDDNIDMFTVSVPVKLNGARFTPWGLVAVMGKDGNAEPVTTRYAARSGAGNALNSVNHWLPLREAAYAAATAQGVPWSNDIRGTSTAYFAGLGGEVTLLDPFRFSFDLAYAGIDTKHRFTDRAGWLFGAAASYKTALGVPTLKAWYATGDDGNVNNGSERIISTGAFNRTGAITFNGGPVGGNMILNMNNPYPGGTWGVSAQWNMLSLVDNMFHNFHVTYIQGTNNRSMAAYADPHYVQQYLTTRDSVIELDFESVYSMYKNLALVLEASYIIQNIDGKLWARAAPGSGVGGLRRQGVDRMHFSNAWNLGLNLRCTF